MTTRITTCLDLLPNLRILRYFFPAQTQERMDLNQLVSLYRVERSSSSSDGTEATTSTTQPTPPSRGYHQPQPQIRTGYHDRRGFQQHQEWGARGRGSPRSTGSNYRMRGRGYRRGFSQQDREDQQATTRAMEQLMNTKLDTPEQIAAWIEERRRRFPTRANAERKRLLEEQDKRLELIKSIDNSTQPDLDSHSIDEHDIPQASALSSLSSSYNEEAISNASEDSTVESDGFDEEAPEELEFRSRLTKNASGNPAQTNDAHAFAADGVPLALEPVKASSQLAPTVLSLFDSGEKKPCKYFQKRGSCRFGARCSFMHVADPSRPLWRNTPKVAERPPSILQKVSFSLPLKSFFDPLSIVSQVAYSNPSRS